MRHIGTIPEESQARVFKDYAFTRKIEMNVEPEDGEWAVWVYDEDNVETASEELKKYLENPDDPEYAASQKRAEALRAENRRKNEQAKKNQVDVRTRWNQPVTAYARLTMLLLTCSVVVAVLTRLGDERNSTYNAMSFASVEDRGNSIAWYGFNSEKNDVRNGQVWRLLTPIFLHFGIMHFVFNMLMLYQLGTPLEMRMGLVRFAALVLVSAVLSNTGEYLVSMPSMPDEPALLGGLLGVHPSPLFGGMSGVIYALFGYAWMKSRHDPGFGLFLSPFSVFILMGWFVLCFTPMIPRVANTAHAVGLVCGLLAGYAPFGFRRLKRMLR